MLELDGLRVVQGEFRLSADLVVPRGDAVAVVGPSGGGKSTLLSAIGGFAAAEAGRVRWDGSDLAGLHPGDRPVTTLFQDGNLFPHLSAAQNVGLGLSPKLRLTPGDRARVSDALAAVGLVGLEDRRPVQLSGGQQGRVALARALVRNRPLVLMDEPFAALGPALRREMLDLVVRTMRAMGATLLLVSHDPDDVLDLVDSVLVVADGVAAGPVTAAAMRDDPPAALRAYLRR